MLSLSKNYWEWVSFIFQFFPLVTITQWFGTYYPAGKTSIISRLNLPGKFGWITMEVPGFLTVLYCMYTIPNDTNWKSLPTDNLVMVVLFTVHYIYRAIIGPLLNPSMSPIHLSVWSAAVIFQIMNGLSIGGYLAGYGPVERHPECALIKTLFGAKAQFKLGIVIWAFGFIGNVIHDEILRDIRRTSRFKRQTFKTETKKSTGTNRDKINVDKFYQIPTGGLFWWILYPHYLCEWIEWTGWWIIGGSYCFPARTFLINELTTMIPRAIQGKNWYIERFGEEKLLGRKAIIPGIL